MKIRDVFAVVSRNRFYELRTVLRKASVQQTQFTGCDCYHSFESIQLCFVPRATNICMHNLQEPIYDS